MSWRVDVRIDRIVVDGAAGLDRRRLAAALEREVAAQLREHGTPAHRDVPSVDGGRIAGGDIADALGARVGTIVAGGGAR